MFARFNQASADFDRVIFAGRHQVQLVAHPLAAFDGQQEQLFNCSSVTSPCGVHQLEQAGEGLVDGAHVAGGDALAMPGSVEQLKAAL
jgi:hypothetical protein